MSLSRAIIAIGLYWHCFMLPVAWAAPIVELTVSGTPYQGLNIAHNEQVCWLAARDGTYERIDLSQVTSFRKPGGEFRSLSPTSLATDLRDTLGRKFEVRSRGQYVVCTPSGQADKYAELLNDVEGSFNSYFNRRGWSLNRASYPLVIVVHPNKHEFDKNCLMMGMVPSQFLKGFYHPQTNRVTLYDLSSDLPPAGARKSARAKTSQLDDATRSVVIHEAIHQLAFNSGLHQRVGQNPRWVVEGLATLLESGALESTSRRKTSGRINPERLSQFRDFRSHRRSGTISDLITHEDELYHSSPLDFYGEAWALTFYLSETHRPDYIRYLKRIAARDPLDETYSPEDRLKDFQAVFGNDLHWIDVQFLRFIDGLE